MGAGLPWAVSAGASAATGAVLAKCASFEELSLVQRVATYFGVLLCNVIMWTCYVTSLKILSSLQATVINFAANFLLSGLAGFLLFGEILHIQWLVGAVLILLGIMVLSNADYQASQSCDKKDS